MQCYSHHVQASGSAILSHCFSAAVLKSTRTCHIIGQVGAQNILTCVAKRIVGQCIHITSILSRANLCQPTSPCHAVPALFSMV